MIYDSSIWKSELKKELEGIKVFFEEFKSKDIDIDEEIDDCSILDIAFVKLQKFSIYTSIIVRKLIEANKISDELESHNFPIENYKKKKQIKVMISNGYEIEEIYDIEKPIESSISIKNLTHCFIHSFHFMPKYEWIKINENSKDEDEEWIAKELLGIYFSSDKTKDKHLSYIDFSNYLSVIEKVMRDFIIYIDYKNGEINNKCSNPENISKEIDDMFERALKKE